MQMVYEMAIIPKVVHLMHAVVHFSCLQVKLRGHIHLIDCMCYTEPCKHSEYNMTEFLCCLCSTCGPLNSSHFEWLLQYVAASLQLADDDKS